MHNWHDSSCRRPDVSVIEGLGIPSCQACGESALLDDEGGTSASGTGLQIPQAIPSKLDLRWPSSVNFIDPDGETTVSAQGSTSQAPASRAPARTSTSPYQVLRGEQIRILHLSPGKHDDAIHIHLETTSFSELPSEGYEALSYTWANSQGDSRKTNTIYVGTHWHILKVTENCASALRRLRNHSAPRDLWVDAVCINQDDLMERTHQVGMMQEIYARAEQVLVYLGEGDVAKLEQLSKRPYFSRMWVIQEIEAARSAKVLWGSHSMIWPEFHAEARKFCAPWLKHFDRRRIRDDMDLFRLLLDTVGCKVSDPRDRVFALLGFVLGRTTYGLDPDYSLSLPAVLVGITAYFLTNVPFSRERILQAATLQKQNNLPSWAPDWSAPWPRLGNQGSPSTEDSVDQDRFVKRDWAISINRDTGALCFEAVQLFVTRCAGWTKYRGWKDRLIRYEAQEAGASLRTSIYTTHVIRGHDVVCKSPEMGFALVIRHIKSVGKTLTGRLVGICSMTCPSPSLFTAILDGSSQSSLDTGLPAMGTKLSKVSPPPPLGELILAAADAGFSVDAEYRKARARLLFCGAIKKHAMATHSLLVEGKASMDAQRRAKRMADFWTEAAAGFWAAYDRTQSYSWSIHKALCNATGLLRRDWHYSAADSGEFLAGHHLLNAFVRSEFRGHYPASKHASYPEKQTFFLRVARAELQAMVATAAHGGFAARNGVSKTEWMEIQVEHELQEKKHTYESVSGSRCLPSRVQVIRQRELWELQREGLRYQNEEWSKEGPEKTFTAFEIV